MDEILSCGTELRFLGCWVRLTVKCVHHAPSTTTIAATTSSDTNNTSISGGDHNNDNNNNGDRQQQQHVRHSTIAHNKDGAEVSIRYYYGLILNMSRDTVILGLARRYAIGHDGAQTEEGTSSAHSSLLPFITISKKSIRRMELYSSPCPKITSSDDDDGNSPPTAVATASGGDGSTAVTVERGVVYEEDDDDEAPVVRDDMRSLTEREHHWKQILSLCYTSTPSSSSPTSTSTKVAADTNGHHRTGSSVSASGIGGGGQAAVMQGELGKMVVRRYLVSRATKWFKKPAPPVEAEAGPLASGNYAFPPAATTTGGGTSSSSSSDGSRGERENTNEPFAETQTQQQRQNEEGGSGGGAEPQRPGRGDDVNASPCPLSEEEKRILEEEREERKLDLQLKTSTHVVGEVAATVNAVLDGVVDALLRSVNRPPEVAALSHAVVHSVHLHGKQWGPDERKYLSHVAQSEAAARSSSSRRRLSPHNLRLTRILTLFSRLFGNDVLIGCCLAVMGGILLGQTVGTLVSSDKLLSNYNPAINWVGIFPAVLCIFMGLGISISSTRDGMMSKTQRRVFHGLSLLLPLLMVPVFVAVGIWNAEGTNFKGETPAQYYSALAKRSDADLCSYQTLHTCSGWEMKCDPAQYRIYKTLSITSETINNTIRHYELYCPTTCKTPTILPYVCGPILSLRLDQNHKELLGMSLVPLILLVLHTIVYLCIWALFRRVVRRDAALQRETERRTQLRERLLQQQQQEGEQQQQEEEEEDAAGDGGGGE